MEQHSYREANSSSASETILFISCNPIVHYCVHKNPPLVPILSQINPVHAFLSYFLMLSSVGIFRNLNG
jgi:alanine dehydrogenase